MKKSPWTAKNPFMSLWLSGANKVAGPARAAFRREAAKATQDVAAEGLKQAADFWSAALVGTPPKRRAAPVKPSKRR